jgi:hypothetical protein
LLLQAGPWYPAVADVAALGLKKGCLTLLHEPQRQQPPVDVQRALQKVRGCF